ncbi:hypothetical protein GZH47_24480 [Paenibacillus rhizovicinus]|uniref:Glycosyltransferase RgtA/B/C/D-like domain-containing protein n=1 Tax=Paenibacillus rhizovicinus TaxID=2704463 RepID=A0A6C0P521_9BACL|nr:hypothetical protein [Paenibacillus rhizovicinus]QHW33644.1 hypothetical protein GZH47_24480 [Paenibacillus rhizovicinus]
MNPKLKKALPLLYLLLAAIVVIAMIPKETYNDPDTFWHIELGNYMMDHHVVLHHAIHTFYNDKLSYIPHEFGFQLIVAALYDAFGWPGTYLLTAICLFLLLLGLYRLAMVSRKELGLDEHHFLLFLLVLIVGAFVYYNYFKIRPQMISSFLIVWFFIYLREFNLRPIKRYACAMIAISIGIANIHAGVWLVIAVFTAMGAAEALIERRLTRMKAATFLAVIAAGFLNVGGPANLLYIFTVTKNHFNMMINEWQPVYFANPVDPRTLLLLAFAMLLPFCMHRKPFRMMLMLGILYLGVSSYKQNLFMWLFMPYFAGTAAELLPYHRIFRIPYRKRWMMLGLAAGLAVNTIWIFASPPEVNAKQYPVDEMNYVNAHGSAGTRPRVIAPYGASGYVMSHGADVLCDGRQDPFVTSASKGVFGYTAFERSMKGFSDILPDIVAYDKPDYVIVNTNSSSRLFRGWAASFGEPVYQGRYGSVFRIKRQG